ncbi:hypothetical protein MA16_Dca009517 [Dendrobium catenatum]|uniref:Uncharacterized protein n=1 Tax=Dendrobium catenatum TaxID=906689 RepID=A0A2I0VRV9_9ASPA|nr:hypothetical protein MA16_Dca009517 [Dendrobium catenatum]
MCLGRNEVEVADFLLKFNPEETGSLRISWESPCINISKGFFDKIPLEAADEHSTREVEASGRFGGRGGIGRGIVKWVRGLCEGRRGFEGQWRLRWRVSRLAASAPSTGMRMRREPISFLIQANAPTAAVIYIADLSCFANQGFISIAVARWK